ncbi:hypothetical protein M409DRAFT_23452 [Zasmidium cellare ATCC 36951]|uniref:Uncharacterized protein n=1 Tax=Zasmidium cellare ATCC 36951 TaxID=1080233 RepID=A0A6A6CJ84_ZASCE|nr:uncharacterized protein M409DRAFT_23452 [Zasmidium cellare ATCC 36951]KAF2166260.1 hypothetical protein M409DRAFT_23452 [Zasmidium cellare ATCC 36951]
MPEKREPGRGRSEWAGLLLKPLLLYRHDSKMFRLPLVGGRLVESFRYAPTGESEVLCWISIDDAELQYCLKHLEWEPQEAIIVVERSSINLLIDRDMPSRGFCLLATNPPIEDRSPEATIYVGPVTWGPASEAGNSSFDDTDREVPLVSHVPIRTQKPILIASDISHWTKLPPSRSRRLRTLKQIVIAQTMVIVLATLGYAIAALINNSDGGTTSSISYSEVYDLLDQTQHCLETTCVRLYLRVSLPQWCAPLAAVVFLCWILSTIRYAVLLLLMYSIQSEVDVSQKWWRQFLTIFEILRVSEVPWYKRPQFVILKVVAKGMGLVAGRSKTRDVARTKGM